GFARVVIPHDVQDAIGNYTTTWLSGGPEGRKAGADHIPRPKILRCCQERSRQPAQRVLRHSVRQYADDGSAFGWNSRVHCRTRPVRSCGLIRPETVRLPGGLPKPQTICFGTREARRGMAELATGIFAIPRPREHLSRHFADL